MTTLRELARFVRSKNAGPFEITFDVVFNDRDTFLGVERSGILNHELICSLYGVESTEIVALLFFEPALAFKFTLRRGWAQGSVGERDTFGAQQHGPLLTIQIPVERPINDEVLSASFSS